MEERPPVPPKDARYSTRMAVEFPATAVNSGSKRKRNADDGPEYNSGQSDVDVVDYDEQTPKRSRPRFQQGDASASEDNAAGKPRLVRKRGSRNLSNLNLRHAAKTQTLTRGESRESRFQEGSLTDRPSEKPPSFFTRMTRNGNRDPTHVDALMEDYHEGMPRARDTHDREGDVPHQDMNVPAGAMKEAEGRGIFKFGRQLAATFRPVTLWKNIWGQSKDELANEHAEEEARKAKQKADAEAKYAQMKRDGQLELLPVGTTIKEALSSVEETSTPLDSAVAFDSLLPSVEASRSTSAATVLRPGQDDFPYHIGNDLSASTNHLPKGLKGRLNHLKKPSLNNIKSDLKRMRSDMSLTGNRESSSSMSPVKNDFDFSVLKKSTSILDLKKSASKADLKKQQKLSKRVSDLESKLSQARRELDNALVEASPMPKLSGNYERFTPSTATRLKFIPGKLPSLPSERLLMAEQGFEVNEDDNSNDEGLDQVRPRKAMELDLEDFMAERDESDGEDTIKASRARPYPTRAISLFNLRGSNNNNNTTTSITDEQLPSTNRPLQEEAIEHQHYHSDARENMDPNSVSELTSDATPQAPKPVDYASLDAKLKALDANVKTARKAAKPKKRKSGPAADDKPFKPTGTESDDELEWEATPKKKQRKTSNSKNEMSPPNKRSPRNGTQHSPPKKSNRKTNGLSPSSAEKAAPKEAAAEQRQAEDLESQEEFSADEADLRASTNSQAPLDPVYEDEEETTGARLDTPSVQLTPSTHLRSTPRSRSTSPTKRAGTVQPGPEEQIITRAGRAAQEHPARQGGSRSSSPPPPGWTKTMVVEETVTVSPGMDGVPQLPKGANGSFESLDAEATEVEFLTAGGVVQQSEEFVWPDDVF